jgi:predicted transcriptional regulator of viral defense system
MSVAKTTRDFVKSVESAKLFTYDDIPDSNKASVAIELSRLFKKGVIKKISNGKFYRPKIKVFGEIAPDINEKIKSYMKKDEGNSYETGINSFRKLGLTTQVSNEIVIATNQSYRKIKIDNVNLRFVPKIVNVKKDDIHLAQILDAIKDIKKIPATTPNEVIKHLKKIIKKESIKNQNKLKNFALKYNPRTRAILGAIFKELGNRFYAYELKLTLNPTTNYKLKIEKDVIKDRKYWNFT